jgi:hypothetical protein
MRGGWWRALYGLLEICEQDCFYAHLMYFEVIGEITEIETIAVGSKIREIARLRRQFGKGRWRKLKGVATVRLKNGRIRKVELHWYEAHGIGKRKLKIKRYLS